MWYSEVLVLLSSLPSLMKVEQTSIYAIFVCRAAMLAGDAEGGGLAEFTLGL
jgi:hypothetical protein